MTCNSNGVIVSTADRCHMVSDVDQLWTEVVNVCISIEAQFAIIHLTTCIQLTILCQTATDKKLKICDHTVLPRPVLLLY